MKKWEYKVILVRKQQVLKENYQQMKAPQICDITYLNQLGEDGWELVSCDVDHEDVGKPATMIFKRSLASLLTRGFPSDANAVGSVLPDATKPSGVVLSKERRTRQ
jgi:hypothetical protein